MNALQKYVDRLPDDEKRLIINDWEYFSEYGSIGDKPLRIHAENVMKEVKCDTHITMWMHQLAFECYRYFYNREY